MTKVLPPGDTAKAKQKPRIAPAAWWLREGAAALIWGFVVIKLFVYDIDLYLIEHYAPRLRPLVTFRFFTILGTIAALWLTLGGRHFRAFVAYVLFYPLVVLFWKLPKLVIGNWAVAIAFFPALHSAIATFKASFIWTTLALLAALAMSISTSKALVITAMTTIALYLARHYVARIRMAFRPSSTFTDIAQLIRNLWRHIEDQVFKKQIAEAAKLDPNSGEYKSKYQGNLTILYLFASVLGFVAEKLRDVAASRKLDLYFIGALVYTLALTVFVFGAQYWALEKLIPGSFQPKEEAGFWPLLGYSFGTLMTAGITRLTSVSGIAQVFSYLELVAGLFILIILVFVILTILRERSKEGMDQVIDELGQSVARIDDVLQGGYRLTLGQTEVILLTVNAKMVNWMRAVRGMQALEPPEGET